MLFYYQILIWKFSHVNVLNSVVAIYLSWLWSVIFFSILLICFMSACLIKLLILRVSPSSSFIWALRETLVAKLVSLGTLSSIFFTLVLYIYIFLTTSFLAHYLIYLNQLEQVVTYQCLIFLPYFSNCLN